MRKGKIVLKIQNHLMLLTLFAIPLNAAKASELECLIEPNQVVNVGTQEEGVIESILAERGDFVEADQTLAKLESSVEQATLALAKATADMDADLRTGTVNLAFTRRKEKSNNALFLKKVISNHEMDEAKTDVRLAAWALYKAKEIRYRAKIDQNRAEVVLNRRSIQSPISGVVMERFLSPGELVKDRPLMKIAQLDPLKVEVIVPVSQYGTIKPGMKAVVKPESPLEGEYIAKVTIVDPVIDAASGTFGVRLELPNPNYQLPGGLRCTVSIRFDSDKDHLNTAGLSH